MVISSGNLQRETRLWVNVERGPCAWHSISCLLFIASFILSSQLWHPLVPCAQRLHIFPTSDHPLNTSSSLCPFLSASHTSPTRYTPFSYHSAKYKWPVDSDNRMYLDSREGRMWNKCDLESMKNGIGGLWTLYCKQDDIEWLKCDSVADAFWIINLIDFCKYMTSS